MTRFSLQNGFAQAAAPARALRIALCTALCLSILSCGGGGNSSMESTSTSSGGTSTGGTTPPTGSTTPSGPNVVSVVVDAGPTSSSPNINTLFTTVTVCVPGTTTCQTIDHIQVDTGSYGLRILAPVLTLALPVPTTAGNALLECTVFVDGYSWGPVASADVKISGESASSVPVQIIGDPNYTNVPAACSGMGPPENNVAAFGANGILGVGVFAQDCGPGCAPTANNGADNGFYYSCSMTSSSCQPTAVVLVSQVSNPVTLFAANNNGVIIQLPSVADPGAATLTGYMIFGIDTQANNASGKQTILTVDPNAGEFTTVFNGQSLTQSFLDTGSNGLYFNDTSVTQCTASGLNGFYCPTSPESLSAMLQGQNGVSDSVSFTIASAANLTANEAAVATLGGTYATSSDTFDWGLPFYYGRTVYTAFQSGTTAVGTGPYVAF
jgi:hypothetical protein